MSVAGVVDPRWVELRRWVGASPERTFTAWTVPEEMSRWLPFAIEGSLAVGTRSTLIWPGRRTWLEMLEAEASRRVRFRWPLGPESARTTEVTVTLQPRGLGTEVAVRDGPFDAADPDQLGAWVAASAGWAEALASLRADLDFSVDLRSR